MREFLKELLRDTPNGRAKLCAAWNGLAVETQIELLRSFSEARYITSMDHAVWLKALSSENEYVRYLATRDLPSEFFGPEISARIASDPSPLVRYARVSGWISGDAPTFWTLPKEQMLAIVGASSPPTAESFAEWVEYAVAKTDVGVDELLDVVVEYMRNPDSIQSDVNFRNADYLSWGWIVKGFNSLWSLVRKTPKAVALVLIRELPVDAEVGIGYSIPDEIVEWLKASPYVGAFLSRADVHFDELRREIFFSTDPRYADHDKWAAALYNFWLSSEEFGELLRSRRELLKQLVLSECLTPVFYEALEDVGLDTYGALEKSAKRLTGELREIEFARLKLYRLARSVVPWNQKEDNREELPDAFQFLNDRIVPSDTWATFMGFQSGFPRNLVHQLPALEDLETDGE